MVSEQTTIVSLMAGDEDFKPLLEMFVGELVNRMDAINTAFAGGDMTVVQDKAHQLKGAGGGYGYPQITEAAKVLEQCVKDGAGADVIKTNIDALGAVCTAAKRGFSA